jgi:hypothetical protein
MMNKVKIAALVAIGLAGISTAQAGTSDLLLGFNDAAGPGAAQNDYVIDLGLSGNELVAAANANSGNYDFSSLYVPSTFTTAFGADASALNNVAVGVVGSITGLLPAYLFQTELTGITPAPAFVGQFKNAAASAASPIAGEYSSSSTTGWSYFVAASPTTAGGAGLVTGGDVADQTGNPLGQLSGGIASLDLWQLTKTSTSTVSSWVDDGTFNINLNSDTITFTASVPEPTDLKLLGAGAVLVLIALRHKFKGQNA